MISDLQCGKVSQRRLFCVRFRFLRNSFVFDFFRTLCAFGCAVFCHKPPGINLFRTLLQRPGGRYLPPHSVPFFHREAVPFSLTPVFATHPKNAPLTPLLATLPKTRVLKVLCLPHIQKMAGVGGILLTKFPMRESVLSDRRESKDQYPFPTDASSTDYCGAPCGRELQPLFHLSTERGALAYD